RELSRAGGARSRSARHDEELDPPLTAAPERVSRTMSDARSLPPQRRRQLAAEHALGVLTGDERSQAIALAREDAEFAQDVARWRGRFAPWLSEVAEAQPPERVWAAIEQRIGTQGEANVVQLSRRVKLWRGFAAAATAVAA